MFRLFMLAPLLALPFVGITQAGTQYLCPGQPLILSAGIIADTYQWEVNRGNGFVVLSEDTVFQGTLTNVLNIAASGTSLSGVAIRCRAGNELGPLYNFYFANTWQGGSSPYWHDPENWSCGRLPDTATHVLIPAGFHITVTDDLHVQSITCDEDATLSIDSGVVVTISGIEIPVYDFNLSDEEIEILDTIGVDIETLDDLVATLETGTETVIQKIIKDMHNEALALSKTWNTTYTGKPFVLDDPKGVVQEPTHTGLAYSYGSRDHTTRLTPPLKTKADAYHKLFSVFGLDCSGFMIKLFNAAGITDFDRMSTNNFKELAMKAMKKKFPEVKLILVDTGSSGFALRDGDILLYKGHMGFYHKENNNPMVYQSNGNPHPETDPGCKTWEYKLNPVTKKMEKTKICLTKYTKAEQQGRNMNLTNINGTPFKRGRGVHPLYVDKAKEYFGKYSVYRFVEFKTEIGKGEQTNSLKAQQLLSDSSVSLRGTVVSDGGSEVVSRGICYSNNPKKFPTVRNLRTFDSSGLGSFTTELKGLTSGTTYIARTYAINGTDTSYSDTITFTTKGATDTLALIVEHGEWRCGEGTIGGTKLGEMEFYYEPNCPKVVSKYRTDSLNFKFNKDGKAFYRLLEYFEEFGVDENCNVTNSAKGYEWEENEIAETDLRMEWSYIPERMTIKLLVYDMDVDGTEDLEILEFRIRSFTPTEMVVDYYDVTSGGAESLGWLRFK